MGNFLDENGVLYLWNKIKAITNNKVDKADGKGLSTNDLTAALKANYDAAYTHSTAAHAPTDAERNTIVGIQKNGQDVAISSTTRKVNITVPTKTSDLSNDSGFITTSDIPEGAAASTTLPKMAGTAAAGTEMAFARGDHIHPSDSTKVDKVTGKGLSTNDFTNTLKTKLDNVDENANYYTHPSYTGRGSGMYKITVDTEGHVSNVTSVTKDDIVGLGIPGEAVTYQNATASASGLMSSADYNKLAAFGDASSYALKTELTNVYKYRGSVATFSALPSSGLTAGDVYNVEENGMNWAWTGTSWDNLGAIFTISSIENSEIDRICV